METLPATVQCQTVAPRQADNDEQLIEIWLHGRSIHTQRAYRSDIDQCLRAVAKPLNRITLRDLQKYADDLEGKDLAPASRHRKLSSIKSLFSWGHRIGYIAFDTARPLRLPSLRETLSQRILTHGEVTRMIAMEPDPRNRVMLLVLYASGIRVSELVALRWKDFQDRDGGCQITVMGKGGRTRSVLLPIPVKTAIFSIRNEAHDDAPMFPSRRGGHLDHFKSVYSIFVSRVDAYTQKHVPELSPQAQGMVGIANAKLIWADNRRFWADPWAGKPEAPAQPIRLDQEIVFASTGTKRPEDPPWKYVEAFAGSDIQTNPPSTNDAVARSGLTFTRQIDHLPPQSVLDEIEQKVDMQEMENVLMDEGIVKFADPQKALLEMIARKRAMGAATIE